MNAAEAIAAAIEKLERLKAESTPGPWDFEYSDESIEVNAGSARTRWNETHDVGTPASSWKTTDRIIEHDDLDELDEREVGLYASDAELIVTLHSTIDAQLAILRTGLTLATAFPDSEWANTVILARAILGGAA